MARGSMQKLSAFILAYNEAAKIKAAVETVLRADETVVIDSHSTDGTAQIGARRNSLALLAGLAAARRLLDAASQLHDGPPYLRHRLVSEFSLAAALSQRRHALHA